MRPILFLFLLVASLGAQTFTEFYADASAGSNLNGGAISTGGDPEAGAYPITYTGGTWVQSTGVFTVASGNPQSDGVTVGDYASVYADAASAPTGFVGKVTARDTTTITVSLTIAAGTAPTDGTGNRTIKIGGAWKGPNSTDTFPFGFVVTALSTATDQNPRVNFKSGTTYSPTVVLTADDAGPITWEGYTTTAGDGGRATFDWSTNAVVYITATGASQVFKSLILTGSASSGTSDGLQVNAVGVVVNSVALSGARGRGFYAMANSHPLFVECEAYGNNTSNTSGLGGFVLQANATCIRCISHDNTGTNGSGFVTGTGTSFVFIDSIADSNGKEGFRLGGTTGARTVMVGCDVYNNSGSGVDIVSTATKALYIENSNFVKNGAYGITNSGSGARTGYLVNNAFGSGTQANVSGTVNGLPTIGVSGSVTLTADVTPWNAPTTGDFRITGTQCKGTGRGTFTETASSYTGTVAYPDIGSAQHQEVAGGGTRAYGVCR